MVAATPLPEAVNMEEQSSVRGPAAWLEWLGFSTMLSWYFLGMLPPEFKVAVLGRSTSLFLHEGLLLVAIAGVTVARIAAGRPLDLGGPQAWAFLVFAFMLAVSSLRGVAVAPARSQAMVKGFLLSTVVPYVLTVNAFSTLRRLKSLVAAACLLLIPVTAFGVANSLLHGAGQFYGFGGISGVTHANAARNAIVLAPLAIWVLSSSRVRWRKVAQCAFIAVLVAAAVLTRSRAGLIASIVLLVGLLLQLRMKGVHLVATGTLALAAMLLILGPRRARLLEVEGELQQVGASLRGGEPSPEDFRSSMERWHVWKGALKVASRDLLTGVGPGGLGHAAGSVLKGDEALAKVNSEHNAFIEALVAAGLPGMVAFLSVVGLAIFQMFRISKGQLATSADLRALAGATALAIVSGLIFLATFDTAVSSLVSFGSPFWSSEMDNSYFVLALSAAVAAVWKRTHARHSEETSRAG